MGLRMFGVLVLFAGALVLQGCGDERGGPFGNGGGPGLNGGGVGFNGGAGGGADACTRYLEENWPPELKPKAAAFCNCAFENGPEQAGSRTQLCLERVL